MRPPKDPSPLADAAAALEHALTLFEQAAATARAQRMDSGRNLERAANAVSHAVAQETQLGARAGALIAALQAADARKKVAADLVLSCGNAVRERQEAWAAVTASFEAFGAEVAGLNAALHGEGANPGTMGERLAALGARADALVSEADAAGFQDLSAAARSRQQQIRGLIAKARRLERR